MNFRCSRRLTSAVAVCACALVAGCGKATTESEAPLAAAASTPQPPADAATPVVQLTSASADAPAAPTLAEDAPPADNYTPPFPERVDLFVAPKRQGGGPATDGGSSGAVELNGFVNVDRLRAVLTIDGQMSNMAEGETQSGVEVISIQPPKVILQRGRQRWQATLE